MRECNGKDMARSNYGQLHERQGKETATVALKLGVS